MNIPSHPRPAMPAWAAYGAAGLILAGAAGWYVLNRPVPGPAAQHFDVSQRGREFRPGVLELKTGDLVRITNDDAGISHHVYVQAPTFNFDSGDQEPGTDVVVPFTAPGTFNVLCAIHPKMRLVVIVK